MNTYKQTVQNYMNKIMQSKLIVRLIKYVLINDSTAMNYVLEEEIFNYSLHGFRSSNLSKIKRDFRFNQFQLNHKIRGIIQLTDKYLTNRKTTTDNLLKLIGANVQTFSNQLGLQI